MSAISPREQREITRANESALEPVVFVHGLWLLASSWDRWRRLFEESGYATLAPSWPDDPETVEEARRRPEVFAHKGVAQVTDHLAEVIRQLRSPPAIVGHSFGGLIAQRLAGQGLATVTVAIDPGALPRCAAVAALGVEGGLPRAHEPRELRARGGAHVRAVPLRVGERAERRRGAQAPRALLRRRSRCPAVPGRHREPEPLDGSVGGHHESGPRAAAHHLGGEGPHGPVGDCERLVQAAAA